MTAAQPVGDEAAALTEEERGALSYILWEHLTSDGWEGLDPSETHALAAVVMAAGWSRLAAARDDRGAADQQAGTRTVRATSLGTLLDALSDAIVATQRPQVLLARDAGLSQKHVSRLLTRQDDGSLRAWQALLDAARLTFAAAVVDAGGGET